MAYLDQFCTIFTGLLFLDCILWWQTKPIRKRLDILLYVKFHQFSLGKIKFFNLFVPPIYRPSKKNIFCDILSLLAKWNMIFCLYGAFLENSLSKQNFPSPHMLAVCMQGEGESLSFFSKASCTVHGFA